VHLCRERDLFTDRATPKNLKRDGGEIKGEGIASDKRRSLPTQTGNGGTVRNFWQLV
jgi:hypothetical protein